MAPALRRVTAPSETSVGRGLDGGRGLEPQGRRGLVAINEPQGACLDPCGFWECKWIHEVFGSVNGSMRFLETCPYPCGFWGLFGATERRTQPSSARSRKWRLRDRWVPGWLHPVPHGCCWGWVPKATLHPPQGSDFSHPAPSCFRNMEFPAGQGQVPNPRAGESVPKPTPREGKIIQVLSLHGLGGHWESVVDSPVLGRAKEESHRLLGWRKPLPSALNTLHHLQGAKPTPKILLLVPPSCHTSHLLLHI